jgi:radical SAM protein (TIGR01212 family)
MRERYYSFNQYLQKKFGQRVQRISIDAGFGCPNLDGTFSQKGCIYCNNKGFGVYAESHKPIEEQITESIDFYKRRIGAEKFILYFQSFSNTHADAKILRQKYDIIKRFSQIVGLFISTRPDCIDEEKLKLIADYKKNYLVWIEYGVQTTHDYLLDLLNRNHTYKDFLVTLDLTRKYGIDVGIHLILGLPSATEKEMIQDAERISCLDIQGVKFHVLHVLRGTALEEMYNKGALELLTERKYVKIICDFLERIPQHFVILRLISDAPPDYLIAPLWINDKNKVLNEIKKEFQNRKTHQGYYLTKLKSKDTSL